jgi:hypothetical protein
MRSETRNRWADEVRRWRSSGQTAREFAAERGLNINTLRQWSSKLKQAEATKPAFIDVTELVTPPKAGVFEVVVGTAVIRVPVDFDPAHLRAVVAALEVR